MLFRSFRTASVPGTFLVEFIPALRHVPAWLPGAGFQTRLANWRAASTKMVDLPYEKAKAATAMVSIAHESTAKLLEMFPGAHVWPIEYWGNPVDARQRSATWPGRSGWHPGRKT